MKSFTTLAVAFLAVSVQARGSPFRGRDIDGKWRTPRETQAAVAIALLPGELSYMAQIDLQEDTTHQTPVYNDKAPAPTARATLSDRNFWKRNTRDNTCAYISGNSSDSLYCAATAGCVVDTTISLVGCCADTITNCNIYTTCLPASSSSAFTTDNGLTLFCSDGTYSECVTHYYVDTIYSGYSLLGCGKTEAVDDVYYQPTSDSSSSSTSRSSSRRTTTTSSSTRTTSSSTTSSITDGTTTTTTPTATVTPISGGSKSNTGAIVGGVVGGVGGIVLIAAGIFFLLRHNKKKQASVPLVAGGSNYAPGAPGGPGQPPMAQNGYYNGVPGGAPGGDAAGAGAAGAGAAAAAAAGYHQYGQPGQQQDNKLYDPYLPQVPPGQGQQYPPQQQQPYDPARASVYTTTASPMGSPQPTQSPQGTVFGTPQPYAGSPDTNGISAQHTGGSPQQPIAPYTAPPPAAGMGFQSGPVASNLAELPTERGHGTVQEMA